MKTTAYKLESIANFAGFTHEKNIGWYDNEQMMPQIVYTENDGNCFDELLFNESWDWLMPVVAKIYNYESPGEIPANLIGNITHHVLDIDIDRTFESVFEFVVWYNQNQL